MSKIVPVKISNIFSETLFSNLKIYVEDIADQMLSVPIQDETFNRHHINDDPNLVKIHEHLEPWLTEYLGKPVKKSYCFLSIYREGGICPKHTDRPQCEYTIDLCVSQKQPWTIYVDDQPFDMQENEAVIYSGTNSPHYRNRLQEGNHCFLVFYHFVDADFVGPLQ